MQRAHHRDSTVPSPTPASNSRSGGGDGCSVDQFERARLAISVFSLQVETEQQIFLAVVEKRKTRRRKVGRKVGSQPALRR